MPKCSLLAVIALLTVPVTLANPRTSAQEPIQHAPDGASQLHVESIDIPTIANVPFSAYVVTELTTIMPDGSKRTNWNRRLVARDSSGRVFQERRFFMPKGNVQPTMLSEIDIEDPNLHEMTMCRPMNKTCHVYPYRQRFVPPAQAASLPPMTKLPNGTTIENEDLGHNTVEGVDCVGSREVRTIPAGLIGNEKAEPVVKEFWYAPQLGVNLITKRFDPRVSGIQNFTVTEVNRSEPDPKIFALPENFKLDR